MVKLEKAIQGDIPGLCDLLAELFAMEQEFSPDARLQASALEMLIASPEQGTVWLARDGREIVGMVTLQYLVSTALGGRVAVLEDMIVSATYRGHGIGEQLLTQAIAHARQMGCLRITLLTDTDNTAAQAFYSKAGFLVSDMLPMRRLLSAG